LSNLPELLLGLAFIVHREGKQVQAVKDNKGLENELQNRTTDLPS
jgi:hypothetical protein